MKDQISLSLEKAAQIEESGLRRLSGPLARLFSLIAIAYGVFQIYTAGAGPYPDMIQRAIHVGLALVLCFALYPMRRGGRWRGRISPLDVGAIVVAIASTVYIVANYNRIMFGVISATWVDMLLGWLTVLVVLEAARRVLGVSLPILAILALAYAYFGPYFPGTWSHRGIGGILLIEQLYVGTQGLWGFLTGISAVLVAIFVIFGVLLVETGGGRSFVELALAFTGRTYGGAAKVAVVGSSLAGTVSGSAAANVVTTGSFTIPMMKRLGYRPELAAAVEATASTGGQIMPPVMGAGAFIMAELTGIPYISIAAAALIPAILYYVAVFAGVHFEAHRLGLKPVQGEEVVRLGIALRRSVPLIVPVAALLWFLISGYTPQTSAFWSVIAAMALYLVTVRSAKDLLRRARNIVTACGNAGRALVLIAVLMACAQIIVSIVDITGVGVKISEAIMSAGGTSLVLALIMAMVTCLVLGMGIPTTAAYVLAASVVMASLTKLGVSLLAAHLFVFYFAVIGAITPPVCGAVFVAAGLAESKWLPTSFIAVRLALSAFIVPFMFVFAPALILEGDAFTIVTNTLTAMIGVISLSAAVMGYLSKPTNILERILLIGAGFLLIDPGHITDLVGVAIFVAVYLIQRYLCPRVPVTPSSSANSHDLPKKG